MASTAYVRTRARRIARLPATAPGHWLRERAARYQVMFGATHAFPPERNGIRPNTLHVILYTVTFTTLVLLGAATALGGVTTDWGY